LTNKDGHYLIQCIRVLLEHLTVLQLVKKLPTFYESRQFVTVFT